MRFNETYTTETRKTRNPTDEANKEVLPSGDFALGTLLESLISTIERGRIHG